MSDNPGGSIIFQWLERIGLGYSIPQFQAYGINSPQALMSLTFEDYDAVGVTELHDRKRLFELVHRVREAASKGAESSSTSNNNNNNNGSSSTVAARAAPKPKPAPRNDAVPVAEPRGQRASAADSGVGADSSTPPSSPSGGRSQDRRAAVAALFRGANIGDEALVQKFTDKLMARDRKEVDSFLANPQKLLMYFSKIMGGSASTSKLPVRKPVDTEREEMRRPRTAASSSGSGDYDGGQGSKRDMGGDRRRAPQTAYSRGADRESGFAAPVRSSRSKWDLPKKGKSAADRNKELNMERERRNERLQNKKGNRRASVGKSVSKVDEDDGPKIRVCVRKRPLSRREKNRKEVDVLKPVSRQTMLVYEPKMKVDLTKFTETHEFHFDEVFGHLCTTRDIYKLTAKPMVAGVFRGLNATIFAYGQTGSGKTFTMMGTNETSSSGKRKHPGIYVLAAQDLFKHLARPEHADLDVSVSFYEIYGGKLFDLLNARKQLRALADHKEAVKIMGLSYRKVTSVPQLLKTIDQGNAARSTGSTGANMDSSRSHAVLQISLHHHKSRKMRGKFSFVDLAGSERGADTTHNDRQTRLEGAEINKSLLALKECIRALYQEHDHTPFRGSKLTQVLKDSFLGNSRTVMIATVSPNITNCEHTLNTLRYAYRVKEIRRPDGEDEAEFEPPHGPDTIDSARARREQEAELKRKRELARRAAAAQYDSDDSDGGGGAAGAGAQQPSRIPRSPRPAPQQVPVHSDIEVDSLGDSDDDPFTPESEPGKRDSPQAPAPAAVAAAPVPGGDDAEVETELIKAHRAQIHEMMDIVKAEMKLVGERNKGEATQMAYVDRVDALLSKKLALIMQLKAKLTRFREHMDM